MGAMNTVAIFAKLADRALVKVSGPDWRGFLQGLLTQDVEGLTSGEIRFAALLTPQGKLLYDLFLIGRDDGCLMDVAAQYRDALVQRLSIYRLRAKVEITAVESAVTALWSEEATPSGDGWLRDPRLPALGWRGYDAAPPASARIADETAYHAHRIALGVPDPAGDCPPETTYPIEANFDLLHGIDFHKGCFVGQETTSRMKRRGAIKTRLVPVAFSGPPPVYGAEVLAGDLRAGEIRLGQDGAAMALLRLDRIDGAALTVDGRALTVTPAAYLEESL
jgi:folate-binding protein YgfZ